MRMTGVERKISPNPRLTLKETLMPVDFASPHSSNLWDRLVTQSFRYMFGELPILSNEGRLRLIERKR